jgi:hypothetical protein
MTENQEALRQELIQAAKEQIETYKDYMEFLASQTSIEEMSSQEVAELKEVLYEMRKMQDLIEEVTNRRV